MSALLAPRRSLPAPRSGRRPGPRLLHDRPAQPRRDRDRNCSRSSANSTARRCSRRSCCSTAKTTCRGRSNRPTAPSCGSACGGSSAPRRSRAARRLARVLARTPARTCSRSYFLDAAYFGAPLAKLCGREEGRPRAEQPRLLAHSPAPRAGPARSAVRGRHAHEHRRRARRRSSNAKGTARTASSCSRTASIPRQFNRLHAAGHVEEARARRLRGEPAAGEEHRRTDAGREGCACDSSRSWSSRWPATASSAPNSNGCTPNSASAIGSCFAAR